MNLNGVSEEARRVLRRVLPAEMRERARVLADEAAVWFRARGKRHGAGPNVRFFIFAGGRCGTSLLVDQLNGQDGVRCDAELLRARCIDPAGYVARRALLSGASVYGFKLLRYHLSEVQGVAVRPALQALIDGGFRPIHLVRDNVLEHALSNLIARQTAVWHVRGDQAAHTRPTSITVDIAGLRRWMISVRGATAREREVLAGFDHLTLSYEVHLAQPELLPGMIERVSDYLGVALSPVASSLRKAVPRDLPSYIRNWDEVTALAHELGRERDLKVNP